MWRQSANWGWPFGPPSEGCGHWLYFTLIGSMFSAITAFAGDGADAPIAAPDFAVIEITLRPGKHRSPLSFTVKLAETEAQRRHGLMFTSYLPERHGMLFVFDTDAPRQFWMKNTQIPLDMLFFTSNGRLVNIVHSAVPLSLTARNSLGPARYVLELNGGAAAEIGIQADAQLALPLAGQ